MDQFVCVRVISANDLDLSRFQFDFDMSFAVNFLNSDGTVYGRYGTRSGKPKEAAEHITLEGLRESMRAVIALHGKYPANKASLAGKSAKKEVRYKTPRELPTLTKYQPKINYQNNVARSCVHCHQIHDAQRQMHRGKGTAIPGNILYPWPMPSVAGIEFEAKSRARIAKTLPGSAAAKAGLRAGDDLLFLDRQAIVSVADVQWILHNAGDSATLDAVVKRGGKNSRLTIALEKGWRTKSDIGWRTSTWDLRRMVLGGMYLEALDDEGRRKAGIAKGKMALIANHVGQYGEHATAKNAGVKKGDIILAAGDFDTATTESELIAHLLQDTKPGTRVEFTYLRSKGRKKASFAMK